MDKEQKAREYAEQFKVDNAPIRSEIEMSKASKYFKAGYEEGQTGKDLETQVAYNCGREAERKEIVEKLKSYTDQLDKEGNFQAVICVNDFLESLSNQQ